MTAVRPVRLQLSRRKGFDLQAWSRAVNGLPAINCARPSRWGNRFVVCANDPVRLKHYGDYRRNVDLWSRWPVADAATAVTAFREVQCVAEWFLRAARTQLRARNLACWCGVCAKHAASGKPFDEPCQNCAPCHTDVLGDIANAPICEAA